MHSGNRSHEKMHGVRARIVDAAICRTMGTCSSNSIGPQNHILRCGDLSRDPKERRSSW
jgi:hypothetical protein